MFLKKILSSFLLLCIIFLTSSANSEIVSSKETIFNFYKVYFSNLNKKNDIPIIKLDYSAQFKRLLIYNKELCRSFPDEVCGWGAHGDVYLDAQDYDENLSMENSNFTISESPANIINVSFYLFPFEKEAHDSQRHISYKMLYENHRWVIDDIIYNNSTSSREQIIDENKLRRDELRQRK